MTTTDTDSPCTYDLSRFVQDVEGLLDGKPSMPITIKEVSRFLFELVQDGSWLPDSHRVGRIDGYARHLLHKDRQNRFVVLALVWQPGQATPIHDHSCWGVMGLLDNSLEEIGFERLDDGSRAGYAELRELQGRQVAAGSTSYLLPPYQEIHAIGNNTKAQSVSVHVYGRDIDEVNVFNPQTNAVSRMRIKYYGAECGGSEFAI